MDKRRILLAEDEEVLGQLVRENLEQRQFEVDLVSDGVAALQAFQARDYDLLVLDVMMPLKDGFTLVREIRQLDEQVPILFLSAKSQASDVVSGFQIGGNDYLKKPFSMEELVVRMENILSRSRRKEEGETLRIGTYSFDFNRQVLQHEEGEVNPLTHREAQLLLYLCRNKNQVLDRSLVLNKLWGKDDFFSARSMDVFITKLRKKLALDPAVQIHNVRGYGYKLVC